jgi:hypothetical protein
MTYPQSADGQENRYRPNMRKAVQMRRVIFVSLVFSFSLLAQMGQLSISVKDEAGLAMPGALVTVSARPMYGGAKSKPGTLTFNFTGRSGANGGLSVTNVPSGAYALCARLPGSLFVDSCSWNDGASSTIVNAGSTASSSIVLKKGALAVVQLTDGLGLLASEAFPGQKVSVVVGTAGGHRIPMAGSQQGATIRQFSAVVPVDTDLKLQVHSQTLQVTDSNGNKLDMKDPKAFIPLRIAAAAATSAASQLLGATAAPHVQISLTGLL